MLKINVGDYVRTKDGILWKTSKIEEIEGKLFFDDYYWFDKEYIKSSPNIIDLVEVGDYVNGREVRDVYKLNEEINYCFKNEYGRHYDKTYKIKSIVTKEQFESMQYNLEK